MSLRRRRACLRRQAADDRAVEPDLARGLALQAEHGAAERGLAAAGFADEPEDLAAAESTG